jgi:hypothetical protein
MDIQAHFPRPRPWCAVAALLTGLLASSPAPAAAPPTLERQLVRQAPGLVRYLQGKGYHHVGVLKFLVLKDTPSFSDNVGTLNMALANRLEVALLLANDPRRPLGVLHNASAVAARTRGANHLNRAGRDKLFGARYPLCWGNQEVQADAFVSGTAQVSKDLRTLTVSLLAFGRDSNRLEQVGADFTAANDSGKLCEMGESFVLRGAFEDDDSASGPQEEQALREAARVKARKARNPLAETPPPVTLEVFYDGRRVPVEVRGGRAFLPEPGEGQKVAFVLGRDGSKERYGVVLKINGENTIGRERLPDLHCHKWILDPGTKPITIEGYQLDEKTAQAFRVLSRKESERNQVNYGADVGTITATVFRDRPGQEKAPDLTDEGEYLAAVQRGKLPETRAENFHALKAQLLEEANRGLIAEGQRIGSKTQAVKFHADPTPVMVATIIYYRP